MAALERLAFRIAPHRGYWPAYGRLSTFLVEWGRATYHRAA